LLSTDLLFLSNLLFSSTWQLPQVIITEAESAAVLATMVAQLLDKVAQGPGHKSPQPALEGRKMGQAGNSLRPSASQNVRGRSCTRSSSRHKENTIDQHASKSKLEDYSKYKADFAGHLDGNENSHPCQPCLHHRSLSRSTTRESGSRSSSAHQRSSSCRHQSKITHESSPQSVILAGKLPEEVHGDYSRHRDNLERKVRDIELQTEDASGDKYDSDSDSETTLESLKNPFETANSPCDSSDASLSFNDILLGSDGDDDDDDDDEDKNNNSNYADHLFPQQQQRYHRSMPMLGLAEPLEVDRPAHPSIFQKHSRNPSESDNHHHASTPNLMLAKCINNHDSKRSLTNFLEDFDDDRRRISSLKSTGSSTEDLRSAMNQVAAKALRSWTTSGGKDDSIHRCQTPPSLNHWKKSLHHSLNDLLGPYDDHEDDINNCFSSPPTVRVISKSLGIGGPVSRARIAGSSRPTREGTDNTHQAVTPTASIVLGRFRRHKSTPNDHNPKAWHNSTGQIQFRDFRRGSRAKRSATEATKKKDKGTALPPRSKSLGTPGITPFRRRQESQNPHGSTRKKSMDGSFNDNSFVTASRIRRRPSFAN